MAFSETLIFPRFTMMDAKPSGKVTFRGRKYGIDRIIRLSGRGVK
jgi:hypothetical protein